MVTWGFGYVCAVDDYKIVRLCKKVFKDSIRVHVYSTRFDKMQRIDDNNTSDNFFGLRIAERLRKPGVLVNETLYWMGGMPNMLDGLLRKIISFDLASDTLDTFPHLEVSTPSLLYGSDNDECFDKLLCVVNGRLSKYGRRLTSGEDVITVLKSPGVKEEIVLSKVLASWMHYENLIGSVGGDKIFTQYYDNYALHLGVFDITSQPWNYTSLMNLDRGPKFETVSYCASLISINSHVTESSEITSSLNHEVRGTILVHWNGANSSASRLPLPESTHDKGIIHCCRWWTPCFTSKRKTESPETHNSSRLGWTEEDETEWQKDAIEQLIDAKAKMENGFMSAVTSRSFIIDRFQKVVGENEVLRSFIIDRFQKVVGENEVLKLRNMSWLNKIISVEA
ncbi:uncharacterized protein LOC141606433 [Silene latifolia]|uniref:uncharacterized protein LOC141606433 n=1 Tax=Silene latifolia TaxID=37657 RepID=UPI003D77D28F